MDKTSIGDRIKCNYEDRWRFCLPRRSPVIIRLDGKAFHTYTRGHSKPFNSRISTAMCEAMLAVCKEISGAKIGYTQSDEISILLTDYDTLQTDAYVDYNIQKLCSIAASICSVTFTQFMLDKPAYFDCRAFSMPKEEVANYFLWRQKDWIRNSVMGLGQVHFSQKQLHKKKVADVHEMLHGVGVNWADCLPWQKNGVFVLAPDFGWRDDLVLNRDVELLRPLIYVGDS